jgi:hypothetical protein
VPKDGKPGDPRSARGASGSSGSSGRGASGSRATGARTTGGKGPAGKGGRTRPVTNVVSPQRPWGLIAAAVAVVVFAGAVLTYAVLKVREADANAIDSVSEIDGVQTYTDLSQDHVTTTVTYEQSPPVGGPHEPPPGWADCTGTVYDVDIRHENAVHSLEHGAVWITYDPAALSDDDIETLADLVEGKAGRMMSPYEGLDAPVSIQAWGHQLKVDSADDPRLEEFADFLTLNSEFTPEPGASCENPDFIAAPRLASEDAAAPADGAAPTAADSSTTAPAVATE